MVDPSVFPKLMVGAFVVAILGFLVRGLSRIAVGADTATLISTPVFLVAVGLAAVAFVLSVLIKLGLVDDGYDSDEPAGG